MFQFVYVVAFSFMDVKKLNFPPNRKEIMRHFGIVNSLLNGKYTF